MPYSRSRCSACGGELRQVRAQLLGPVDQAVELEAQSAERLVDIGRGGESAHDLDAVANEHERQQLVVDVEVGDQRRIGQRGQPVRPRRLARATVTARAPSGRGQLPRSS